MHRTPWTSAIPVLSSIPYDSCWEEVDDEGSIWFVALDKEGRTVERALLEAKGLRKQHQDAADALAETKRNEAETKKNRLNDLRQKLSQGAINSSERDELLLLIAESIQ